MKVIKINKSMDLHMKYESAKMNTEIVNLICEDQESFDEVSEMVSLDENNEDYVDNSGVLEIWGTRHLQCGNQDYRIHLFTEETQKLNLGLQEG